MELSCKFGNFVLPYCKQVVNFYYHLDLEVVGLEIDLVFEEMVMKVVDSHCEVEFVEHAKDNIVEEK